MPRELPWRELTAELSLSGTAPPKRKGPGISQVPRRSIMIRAGVRARLRDAPDGLFHKHGNRPVEACRYGDPTLLGGATLNQHGAGPRLRAWDPCPSSPSAVSPDNGEAPEPRGGSSTDPPPGGTSDSRSAVCHPRWPHPPGRCHLKPGEHGAGPRLRAWDPCPSSPAAVWLPTTGRRQNPEAGRPPTRLQEAQVTQGQLCATRGGPTLLGGATLTR